jgi:hypothetical protein
MKELFKKNFAIILAFAIPIVIMIGVAISVSLPSLFVSTNYNFVYATCSTNNGSYPYNYNCNKYLERRYSVVDNKLVVNKPDMAVIEYDINGKAVKTIPEEQIYDDHIFIHNTKNNESREVNIEEVTSLNLNGLLTSPDGVTVSNGYSNNGSSDFFIFGGRSSTYGYYLSKGRNKIKLNLVNNTDNYYNSNNFHFVGWILTDGITKK